MNPMVAMIQYHQQVQAATQEKMARINKAIALLRQDKLRGFRVDIETDSTINDNAQEEKQARVEFMAALSGFVKESMQAVQTYPDMLPLLGKSILFTVRGFRVGRDLESAIEEFIDKAEKDVKKQEGQPKPPSPEQIKANADMQMSQASLQEAKIKAGADQARSQAEIEANKIQAAADQQTLQLKQQMQQVELQIKMLEAKQKDQEMQNRTQYEAAQHAARMQLLTLETESKKQDYLAQERSRQQDYALKTHEANLAAQSSLHEARIDAQTREHEATTNAIVGSHEAALKAHDAKLKAREKHPNKKLPASPDIPTPPPPPSSPLTEEQSPMIGARKAKDGKWYVPDHGRPGKYMRVDRSGS
jgi:hypothetical protein